MLPDNDALTLGFLGVGQFAAYTVTAIRRGGFSGRILLSPRNWNRAHWLEGEFNCCVMESNQAVVEESNLIVLSVRPADVRELLLKLEFSSEQVLLSGVAGVTLDQLRGMCSEPGQIVRFMPACFIEAAEGPIPIFPNHPLVDKVMRRVGPVFAFDSEDKFELSVLAATMNSWLYALYHELVQWFVGSGWDYDQARNLVLRYVKGSLDYAHKRSDDDLRKIALDIASEGTFARAGLQQLTSAGGLSAWVQGLDLVAAAIRHAGNKI